MILRAFLVDDEHLALDRLRRLLHQTGRVEVIGATTKPEEAVKALTADPPDVCFLDIQMPRLTGFDVLTRLPQQPMVVFTTAYDQYALRAFGVNSVDYLLKPIELEALIRALDKIEHLRGLRSTIQPDLEILLRRVADSMGAAQAKFPDRIASRLGDRVRFLDLDRVSHFYAEDKLTWAAFEGKPHCVDHSIVELERKLDPKKFARIHRATLVNLAWVREVASLPGGALNLRLKDAVGTELIVARDRTSAFRTHFAL